MIEVREDLHMLIIQFLDAEATEHGFLVSDGLVMANTGRESS